MIVVDPLDVNVSRRQQSGQLDVDRLALNRMPRQRVVRQKDCDRLAAAHRPDVDGVVRARDGQGFGAQSMQ